MMVHAVDPRVGQTVYDPAVGSGGFLIQAYDYMVQQDKTEKELEFLKRESFFGNEKTGLAYIM